MKVTDFPAEYYISIYFWPKVNFMTLSNSSCLQATVPRPRALHLERVALTKACWRRLGWPMLNQNYLRKTVKTVSSARMEQWTGSSCPAGMRVCAMGVWSTFSSAQCVGSLFKNLFPCAVKRSKMNPHKFSRVLPSEQTFSGKPRRIRLYSQVGDVEPKAFSLHGKIFNVTLLVAFFHVNAAYDY